MLLFGTLVALAGLWSLSPVRRALGPFESPAALLLVLAAVFALYTVDRLA